jgi:hypothetical protein
MQLVLLSCFLSIGCVGLVYLLRLYVIEMYDFSLPFGNHCVSVLIHVLLCQQRTILKLMGLQNVTTGLLNSCFAVIALLSSQSGVFFCHSVSLL